MNIIETNSVYIYTHPCAHLHLNVLVRGDVGTLVCGETNTYVVLRILLL